MKSTIVGIITVIFWWILFMTKLFLSSIGMIGNGQVLSFDVDSKENIYIGTLSRINVYKDGTLIKNLKAPTSHEYRFYIEDDKLIIGFAAGGKGGVYDLDGKELSFGEMSYDDIKNTAKNNTVLVGDHEYKFSNRFGILPYIITRDGMEVHRMSTLDYVLNGFPFMLSCVFLFFVIAIIAIIKLSAYQTARLNGTNVWKALWK